MFQGDRAGRAGEGKKRRRRRRRRGERSPWKDVGVAASRRLGWAPGPRAFEFNDLSSFLGPQLPRQDHYDGKWTVQINRSGNSSLLYFRVLQKKKILSPSPFQIFHPASARLRDAATAITLSGFSDAPPSPLRHSRVRWIDATVTSRRPEEDACFSPDADDPRHRLPRQRRRRHHLASRQTPRSPPTLSHARSSSLRRSLCQIFIVPFTSDEHPTGMPTLCLH
jgi:hypothetical protein